MVANILRFLAPRSRPLTVETQIAFDIVNEEAERWAARHAGMLVTEINAETRRALRAFVSEAIANGVPPARLATQIRSIIGLHSRQAIAVLNAQMRLEQAAPGSLVKLGKVRVRVPADGLPAGRIRQLGRAYADRLQRQRATMIARTETLAASNEGQRQLWANRVRDGLMQTAEREWITTPDDRACPICIAVDGQKRRVDEPFQVPGVGTVMNPPAHPSCRCAQGLSSAPAQSAGGRR